MLAARCAEAAELVRILGLVPMPSDPAERTKVSIAYRMANEAHLAAELEYQQAALALRQAHGPEALCSFQ